MALGIGTYDFTIGRSEHMAEHVVVHVVRLVAAVGLELHGGDVAFGEPDVEVGVLEGSVEGFVQGDVDGGHSPGSISEVAVVVGADADVHGRFKLEALCHGGFPLGIFLQAALAVDHTVGPGLYAPVGVVFLADFGSESEG